MAKNIANKERRLDKNQPPYAEWNYGTWNFRLLKSWQADNSKPYARWFMAVESPNTFGSYDLGDTYVEELRPTLRVAARQGKVTVDTTLWPGGVPEFLAWAEGHEAQRSSPEGAGARGGNASAWL